MQHKSEVHDLLMNFVKFIQTQFYTTIKIVRSDNKVEFYLSNHFLLLVALNLSTHLCLYSTKNGIVECKHRRILNVARSPLFQSQAPLIFFF